jgi:O-antigen/teichoic acid export membrane protein
MSSLLKNFSALTVLRALNVLVPLALYPWLIVQLGAETLGIVVFAQAVATYFMVVPNYNMETFGTGLIAKVSGNSSALKSVTSQLLGLKVLLFTLASAAYILLVAMWPFARQHAAIFLLSMHLFVQEAFLPTWFFQGIQRVNVVATYNGLSKLLAVLWILAFVRGPQTAFHVPLGYLVGSLSAALAATYSMRQVLKGFTLPGLQAIQTLLKTGWPYFITSVNGYLYVYANRVLMGFFGMSYVAYYDLADKWLQMGKAPQQILGLSLFPKISQAQSPKAILKRFGPPSVAFNALLALGLFFSAGWIVQFSIPGMDAESYQLAKGLMQTLSLNILLSGLNSLFVIQGLMGSGDGTSVMWLTLETLVFFALGVGVLFVVGQFSPIALTTAAVAAEAYLVIRSGLIIRKKWKSWD